LPSPDLLRLLRRRSSVEDKEDGFELRCREDEPSSRLEEEDDPDGRPLLEDDGFLEEDSDFRRSRDEDVRSDVPDSLRPPPCDEELPRTLLLPPCVDEDPKSLLLPPWDEAESNFRLELDRSIFIFRLELVRSNFRLELDRSKSRFELDRFELDRLTPRCFGSDAEEDRDVTGGRDDEDEDGADADGFLDGCIFAMDRVLLRLEYTDMSSSGGYVTEKPSHEFSS